MQKFQAWTNTELQILKKNYHKLHIDDMVKMFPNRTRMAVLRKASYLGLKTDKSKIYKIYEIDNKFFDSPNINNCYWAGFIAADGNLGKDNSVVIQLQKRDKILLESFAKAVKYNGPISDEKGGYVRLAFWGMHRWRKRLFKHWNITPNKTDTLKPPNIYSKTHILAFIIGYIDGDGSIFRLKKGNVLGFSVCGTPEMMKWIGDILYSLENNNKYMPYTLVNNGNSKTNKSIRCSRQRAKLLLDSLAKIPVNFKLPRKWNKVYE